MARTLRQPALARHALAIVVTMLLFLSLMPARTLGWVGWFGDLTDRVITPIVHPVSWVGGLFVPHAKRQLQRDLGQLNELYDQEKLQRLQFAEENKRLRALVDELSRGSALSPESPIAQVIRPVIEPSGRLMHIRGGTEDGIAQGTVVITGGVQLVGRVRRASPGASWVQPITARDAGPVRCVVLLDDSGDALRSCLLKPTGSGTLSGEVEASEPVLPPAMPIELGVGQSVRLDDHQWPDHARMLVVGTIERVEPHPDQPLRQVITVRPTIALGRLGEVVFRIEGGAP